MENIKIRKANIDDLFEIQKLNKELFELESNNFDSTLITEWPLTQEGKEYFESAIINDIVIVASVDKKIVGYLAGTFNSQYSYNNITQAELDNMCIMNEYRKLGIGTKLFEEFKKICKENGINEIKVEASYNNINAIEFYKRNGFKEAELTLKQNID